MWFKVDDGFGTHPKVLSIPRSKRLPAIGLWTIAGVWCSKQLTDGFVPDYMLEEWGADVSHAESLGTAGLWEREEGGWRFHDWSPIQPTRADVLADREHERRRKEAWRAKKRANAGQSPDGTTDGTDGGHPQASQQASGDTDPTRPDPTNVSDSATAESPAGKGKKPSAKRGTRIPDPFIVTGSMREWAAEEVPGLDVDSRTREFVDYWRAVPGQRGVKLDWIATWRNWLRRKHEDGGGGSRPAAPGPTGGPRRPTNEEANLLAFRQRYEGGGNGHEGDAPALGAGVGH